MIPDACQVDIAHTPSVGGDRPSGDGADDDVICWDVVEMSQLGLNRALCCSVPIFMYTMYSSCSGPGA